ERVERELFERLVVDAEARKVERLQRAAAKIVERRREALHLDELRACANVEAHETREPDRVVPQRGFVGRRVRGVAPVETRQERVAIELQHLELWHRRQREDLERVRGEVELAQRRAQRPECRDKRRAVGEAARVERELRERREGLAEARRQRTQLVLGERHLRDVAQRERILGERLERERDELELRGVWKLREEARVVGPRRDERDGVCRD